METEDVFQHHLDKHEASLLESLHLQWCKEEYCDLVIHTRDKPLLAHTCVLAAFSPKIASLVTKASTRTTCVGSAQLYIVEVAFSYEVMKTIVSALYTGVFWSQAQILKDVFVAVQWLKIGELIAVVEKYPLNENSSKGEKESVIPPAENRTSQSHLFPSLVSALKAPPQAEANEIFILIEEATKDTAGENEFSTDTTPYTSSLKLASHLGEKRTLVPQQSDEAKRAMASQQSDEAKRAMASRQSDPAKRAMASQHSDPAKRTLATEQSDQAKRTLASQQSDQAVIIKLPSLGMMNQMTLDNIVMLEIDSSCMVNFGSIAQSTNLSATSEWVQDVKSEVVEEPPPENENSLPELGIIIADRPKPEKSRIKPSIGPQRRMKFSTQKKKYLKLQRNPELSRTAVNIRGSDRKGERKRVWKKTSQSDDSASRWMNKSKLRASFIEEVNKEDPVKEEELNFLMGNANFLRCKKCGDKFGNLELFHEHVKNHPEFSCSDCDVTFYNKAFLTRHLRAVHSNREFLKCRHCGFQAQSQVMLREHCDSMHQDSKPFCCPKEGCTYQARKYNSVSKHMIVHSQEKEFICNKCNQSFARQISLVFHQRACNHLQEFLCDICGQAFNHVQSMRMHRQSIHFGERRHKCSVCSSAFTDHRNLSRHMRIHKNSFPYSCPVCQQKYRHSNSLKAHLASKHEDWPENVQQCFATSQNSSKLGGASYKRVLKNSHTIATTGGPNVEGERRTRKRATKVKREASSPTQMFHSTSFTGDFLMPPEDTTFDTSNHDLELAIDGAHCLGDLSCISKPLELSGESSSVWVPIGST